MRLNNESFHNEIISILERDKNLFSQMENSGQFDFELLKSMAVRQLIVLKELQRDFQCLKYDNKKVMSKKKSK